jgi:hypothetical protein
MKKSVFAALLVSMLFVSRASAQQSANPNNADGFANGQVVLPDASILNGSIKENFRKKGELVIVADGKKTKYKAGDISSAKIGSSNYITNNYTFYEVVYAGQHLSLLRKASEPSVQYNGADAIVVTSEGSVDDLFVKKADGTINLLTKKNYKEVLGACAGTIDAFSVENVKKGVEACDK